MVSLTLFPSVKLVHQSTQHLGGPMSPRTNAGRQARDSHYSECFLTSERVHVVTDHIRAYSATAGPTNTTATAGPRALSANTAATGPANTATTPGKPTTATADTTIVNDVTVAPGTANTTAAHHGAIEESTTSRRGCPVGFCSSYVSQFGAEQFRSRFSECSNVLCD